MRPWRPCWPTSAATTNEITVTGANLHINSGSGSTGGTVNGLGNLIVGYNELRGSGDDRNGSHNIVVGTMQNYSSHGGLVAGYHNTISGDYASVSGGRNNNAQGSYASVSGGNGNTASGYVASISGGDSNTADNNFASVSGDANNTASGSAASVCGGGGPASTDGNVAFGHYTAILGGQKNIAGDHDQSDHMIGLQATVSGGYGNTASGANSSGNGGYGNTASGLYSSVAGGSNNRTGGLYAHVSGGRYNQASGDYSFVGGGGSTQDGYGNEAIGPYSAILGGHFNRAGYSNSDPEFAAVAGGQRNRAYGYCASVTGGYFNFATGTSATVSGGAEVIADIDNAWAAGTYHSP